MRGGPVAVQAAVAAGALALAAVVWLRPPPQGAPGEVPVAPLKRGDVRAVHWDDGSHRVDVWRSAEPERAVWVRTAPSPSLLRPDAGSGTESGTVPDAGVTATAGRADAGVRGRADGGTSDALRAIREAPPPPERELRGNELAEALLARVSPPMAIRDLGTASAERRSELGLAVTTKQLQLEALTGTLVFTVSTPPGAAGAYLLAPDGHLWLVQDSLPLDLSAASSRLVDRRLHAFRQDEPDALQLQVDGRTRSFVVRRAQGSTRVAPAETPDAPSPEVTSWADRAWKLTPLEVLGRGETPREGTPVVSLRIEYLRARKPLGFLELGRAGNEWFARTEHTAGWVRLQPQAGALREQAERLEGGGSPPR